MKSSAKLIFETILALSATIVLVIAPLAARAGDGPPEPPAFEAFDENGDGTLSKEEFEAGRAARHAAMAEQGRPMHGMAGAPSFADFDSDGDGKLTPAEFRAGHARHMHGMRGKHHPHGGGGARRPHATFEAIDLNGDGCIDRAELDAHHAGRAAD